MSPYADSPHANSASETVVGQLRVIHNPPVRESLEKSPNFGLQKPDRTSEVKRSRRAKIGPDAGAGMALPKKLSLPRPNGFGSARHRLLTTLRASARSAQNGHVQPFYSIRDVAT